MEYWLSLDLSWSTGSLALHVQEAQGPRLLHERVVGSDYHHSEKLVDALEAALSETGISLDRVDRFVTTSGPGSFTGLRIAYATLKAFAMAKPRPIETLSGSEARAVAWLKRQPSPTVDEIYVFTHCSLDKFVRAKFELTHARFESKGESVVAANSITLIDEGHSAYLVDKDSSKAMIPVDSSTQVEVFPLKATYLAEALLSASSRQTHKTLDEWIAMSPRYFGDTRF